MGGADVLDDYSSFRSILITGEKRSGTTLVANYLNSQDQCVVYADFLKSLFREAKKLGIDDLTADLSERQKNVLISNLIAEGLRIGVDEFQDIDRNDVKTWIGLYRRALECLDRGRNNRVIGTKVTCAYPYLPGLLDQGVQVICCVRDPRDVMLSAKNRFSQYNLFKVARDWRQGVAIAESLRRHPSFLIVKFERLIEREGRREVAAELSRFLEANIDPDPDTLVMLTDGRFADNSSFGDIEEPFDCRAIGRWKKHVASAEVVFGSVFLRKEIESLGYDNHRVQRSGCRALYKDYILYLVKSTLKQCLLRAYSLAFGP